MRSKETNYRDYTQKKKKKTKFLGNISEEPVPSKEEAAYTFTVSEERFPYWISCLVLLYWEDLQNTFEVSWSDAVDKENVLVEHLIKMGHDENSDLSDFSDFARSGPRSDFSSFAL